MTDATSLVDGDNVPVRHFGVILDLPAWEALAAKLEAAGTKFIIEPYVRFKGQPGRAGDDVLPRPVRQRARVQVVRRHRPAVRRRIPEAPMRIVISEFMDDAAVAALAAQLRHAATTRASSIGPTRCAASLPTPTR